MERADRAVLETAVRNYVFREFSTEDLIEFAVHGICKQYIENATPEEREQFIEQHIEE